jgi:hypothetical protein
MVIRLDALWVLIQIGALVAFGGALMQLAQHPSRAARARNGDGRAWHEK